MSLDILRGLSFANWARIHHRDLSTGNILISEDGLVKVADFGVGKVGGVEGSNTPTGTASIRAPECYVSYTKQLVSCDIWSFGIILSRLVLHKFEGWEYGDPKLEDEEEEWFSNFSKEYAITTSEKQQIRGNRSAALMVPPEDKQCFFSIIKECLHLMPERRISMLRLFQEFTKFGSKDVLSGARNEIQALLNAVNR
jgi:serine/threonine protein kinase